MEPVRIGVVGATRVAEYALLAPAAQQPAVEVAVVAARDPRRAAAFAARHGIGTVLGSYSELVESPLVDAVYIGLPNALHLPWALAAIESGKHVLVEKPVTANAAEARRLVEAGRRAGVVVAEAHHWRYHPLAARIRQLVDAGAVGAVRSADAWFDCRVDDPTDIRWDPELAGGALLDLGCYTVQWLRLALPGRLRVTWASARRTAAGVDEATEAVLAGPYGATDRLRCDMRAERPGSSLTVTGTTGELTVRTMAAPHEGHRLTLRDRSGERAETVPGGTTYQHQLAALADAVRIGRPLPTGGDDAVDTMRLLDEVASAAGLGTRRSSTLTGVR